MHVRSLIHSVTAYFQQKPDANVSSQRVQFGTSGHRGCALSNSFNENHILSITQAIVDYRCLEGLTGPLFLGIDTHALSIPAYGSVIQVLIANDIDVCVHPTGGYTPTPLISHAILHHNRLNPNSLADGIVITPSHNPPGDGGIKYNTPNGGPAASDITQHIELNANSYLENELCNVHLTNLSHALNAVIPFNFVDLYVEGLPSIINIDAIKLAGISLAVDPLGGSSLEVWQAITQRFDLRLCVVNVSQDPTFAFMPKDHDGQIRMDCSSPFAMSHLDSLKNVYDLVLGNDPDADRHGILDFNGLMNPNHFLSVAIDYLLTHRDWDSNSAVGKTLVSSSMIDRVVKKHARPLFEVPVGFKWFVERLHQQSIVFAGEESAGASFLTMSGEPWSTDKDGIILCLLAAEIFSVTGLSPSQYYQRLKTSLGSPHYKRVDSPASPEQKKILSSMKTSDIHVTHLINDPIIDIQVKALGNQKSIGGVKVITQNGWFAARPSGTENMYKIYAESFVDQVHLDRLIEEAQRVVEKAFNTDA